MKKAKFEISGEVYRITEIKGDKVEIALATETDNLIYVCVPRRCCNPHKWEVSDFIKINGTINNMEDSVDGTLNKVEFSQAILKRLFTLDTENREIDYSTSFVLNGDILDVVPEDSENYTIVLLTDDGLYTIHCNTYTLFHNIIKLDLSKKFRINGVVYITNHSHYCYQGNAISRIQYIATRIMCI